MYQNEMRLSISLYSFDIFEKAFLLFRCRKKDKRELPYSTYKPSCTRHNDMVAAQIPYVMSQIKAHVTCLLIC